MILFVIRNKKAGFFCCPRDPQVILAVAIKTGQLWVCPQGLVSSTAIYPSIPMNYSETERHVQPESLAIQIS